MTSSSSSIRQPEKAAIVAEPAMSASPVLRPEALSSAASPPRPSSGAAASSAMLLYASRPTSASGTPATEDHGPLSTSAQPPPVAAHSVSTPPPPPSLSQLRKPVSAAPRVASAETTVRPCRASSSGAALALRATPRHRAGARVWRAVKGRSASPHATSEATSTAATRIPDGTRTGEAAAATHPETGLHRNMWSAGFPSSGCVVRWKCSLLGLVVQVEAEAARSEAGGGGAEVEERG